VSARVAIADIQGQSLVIQHPGELPAVPLDRGAEPAPRFQRRMVAGRPMFEGAWRTSSATSVRDTTAEMRIVTASVTANSRKQTPDHILHEKAAE